MTRINKNAGSRADVRVNTQQLLLSDGHVSSRNDEARSMAVFVFHDEIKINQAKSGRGSARQCNARTLRES